MTSFTSSGNPILAALRAAPLKLRPWAAACLLDAMGADLTAPELFREPVRRASPEQVDHAGRVLRRLSKVEQGA